MEKISIPNSQGKAIAAVVHHSETPTNRLAILCSGYLDSKDYHGLVELAKTLTVQGYTVVRFDATGIWDSEGSIEEYTMSQYLKDIASVLETMIYRQHYSHILLGGHSRGGVMAILYAARDARISSVLAIMPSTPSLSIQRRAPWEQNGFEVSLRNLPDKTGTLEFRVPFSHVLDREQYDVLHDVNKLHVPLILLAGELDTVVPPDNVRQIFDAANEPKQFILMPGIGHDYRHNLDEVQKVNKEIVNLLKL